MSDKQTADERKRQEWLEIIESDPDLFLAMAENTSIGRRLLKAIREQDIQSQAKMTNTAERQVSKAEAVEALESIDRTYYRRERLAFMEGDSGGYVSGNVPWTSIVQLIEYARQQVVNENPNLYVLQDSRELPDNQMKFWSKSAQGYTTELSEAHRFTEAEARAQHESRSTDIPHRVGDLKPATSQMLAAAAQQVSLARKQVSQPLDPMAVPTPEAPALDTLHEYRLPGGEYYNAEAIRLRFQEHQQADTPVLVTASVDTPNLLDTVIVNPFNDQVTEQKNDPNTIVQEMTLADFVSVMWQYPNAHTAMSYSSWRQVCDLVEPNMEFLGLFDTKVARSLTDDLATDTPPVVARQRLALLDAFAIPGNLKAKMRLADLEMAALYGEPTTDALFDTENANSWRRMVMNADVGSAAESHAQYQDMIQDMRDEIQKDADSGRPIEDTSRFALALLELSVWENEQRLDSKMAFLERENDRFLSTEDVLDLGEEPDHNHDQQRVNL